VQRLHQQVLEAKGQPSTPATVDSPTPSRRSSKRDRRASGWQHTTPIVFVGNKCDREEDRLVSTAELRRLAETIGPRGQPFGGCMEASARRNVNIEEIFLNLFQIAKLPSEMSPSLHHKVQPSYVSGGSSVSSGGSPGGGSLKGFPETPPSGGGSRRKMTLRRRLSDACGAVTPNVRRPSIRTDLLLLQARQELIEGCKSQMVSKKNCIVQ